MQQKKIVFGTTYSVTIVSANKDVIIVTAHEINEGFVLVGHGIQNLPYEGDKGTIVFERGGPVAFWQYYPDKQPL